MSNETNSKDIVKSALDAFIPNVEDELSREIEALHREQIAIEEEHEELQIRKEEFFNNLYEYSLSNHVPEDYRLNDLLAMCDKRYELEKELVIKTLKLWSKYSEAFKIQEQICGPIAEYKEEEEKGDKEEEGKVEDEKGKEEDKPKDTKGLILGILEEIKDFSKDSKVDEDPKVDEDDDKSDDNATDDSDDDSVDGHSCYECCVFPNITPTEELKDHPIIAIEDDKSEY
jgi:hypothetical protein